MPVPQSCPFTHLDLVGSSGHPNLTPSLSGEPGEAQFFDGAHTGITEALDWKREYEAEMRSYDEDMRQEYEPAPSEYAGW